MKEGLLSWSPCRPFLSLPTSLSTRSKTTHFLKTNNSVFATLNSTEESPLTARERRQLRKERRETMPAYNWREEVEERLIKKTKKRYTSWTEELNLDNLALLGPQWWVVRVSRVSGQTTAELLARSLARNFPDMDFKVYVPAVQVKRKLKNGSLSVKPKALFPGCVFLRCILNKEIHDFIREYDGVGGFVGSKVGNKKRQINKPRPVSTDDMEAIFQQAKEEQAKTDQAFKEEQQAEGVNLEDLNVAYTDSQLSPKDSTESVIVSKPRRQSRKTSSSPTGYKLLRKGSSVRILSGTFAEFTGVLKKLERKTGRATVGFTLFGKETLVDLDVNEIVVGTK